MYMNIYLLWISHMYIYIYILKILESRERSDPASGENADGAIIVSHLVSLISHVLTTK